MNRFWGKGAGIERKNNEVVAAKCQNGNGSKRGMAIVAQIDKQRALGLKNLKLDTPCDQD